MGRNLPNVISSVCMMNIFGQLMILQLLEKTAIMFKAHLVSLVWTTNPLVLWI